MYRLWRIIVSDRKSGVFVRKKQTFNLKDCWLDKKNLILVLPDSTNVFMMKERTDSLVVYSLLFLAYVGADAVSSVPGISELLAIESSSIDGELSVGRFLDDIYMPIKSIEGETNMGCFISKQIYDLVKDQFGWGSPELYKISDDVECFCIVPDLDFYEIYKNIIAARSVSEASLLSLKERLSIK